MQKDADAVGRPRHRHFHWIHVLKLLTSHHLPEEGMTSIDQICLTPTFSIPDLILTST